MESRMITWQGVHGPHTPTEVAWESGGKFGRPMPQPGVAVGAPHALARVNHGRWIADCPFADCRGAEMVDVLNPSFFCCTCRNDDTGGQPVPVELPSAAQRRAIEAVLAKRAQRFRNWRPGETVAMLKAENTAHGVGV